MRFSVYIILSFTVLMSQGCLSRVFYQPIIAGTSIETVNIANKASKENIAIRYAGDFPTYIEFKMNNHHYIRSGGEEKLSVCGWDETASSNIPIAATYTLLVNLDELFNEVVLLNDKTNKTYDNQCKGEFAGTTVKHNGECSGADQAIP